MQRIQSNLHLCFRAGISSCGTRIHDNVYVHHAALANMAASICRVSQQPEHFAAFVQATLHSIGFTHGFGKLASADKTRKVPLTLVPPVLRNPELQRHMPGAFSQVTLSRMAGCCDTPLPDAVSDCLPRVINSHESWCNTVTPLLKR